jgi:hypothetical protein
MAKIKKYANGGSYTITVKDSPKAEKEVAVPKAKAPIVGWNIPELKK